MLNNLRPRLNQLGEPIQSLLERDFRRRPTVQELLSVSVFKQFYLIGKNQPSSGRIFKSHLLFTNPKIRIQKNYNLNRPSFSF